MDMRIERAKDNLADAEVTVEVLRTLLAEAESKAAICRSLVNAAERPVRTRWEVENRPPSPDTRTDEELKLDHRSGSAANSAECREEFIEWLGNHGTPGDWCKTSAMCGDLNSWPRFTKHVVDTILEQLVTDGIVEVQRNSYSNWPYRVRLSKG